MWYIAMIEEFTPSAAKLCRGVLAVGPWEFSRAGSKDEVNLT